MRNRLVGVLLFSVAALPWGVAQSADALTARISHIASDRCDACHGANGQGKNPMFPKLAGQNPDYLIDQIGKFKSGVRKGYVMRFQLNDLSDTDVAELTRHYSQQRLAPDAVRDAGRNAAGRKIYLEGVAANAIAACASCHGGDGRGAKAMPRLAGQHADYIAEQIDRFVDATRLPGQVQAHPALAHLSDEQIRAVSDYLSSLD
jgi:cytochrome c553